MARYDTGRLTRRISRLLHPRGLALALIVLSAAVLLSLCLSETVQSPVLRYFAYLYSTYALVIFCAWLPKGIGFCGNRIRRLAKSHARFGAAYGLYLDMERRTRALLVPSLILNLAYALFKLIAGLWLRSTWLFGAGVYYTVLAALRYTLLRTFYANASDSARAWKAYRNTALWLLALTIAMAGLIVQMVVSGKAYHYPGVLIYAFALYAFIKVISAVSALIRHRHGENRLLAASRCTSFACALMSLLALQTALIHQFGNDPSFAMKANALLGLGVCLAMLGICLFMLLRWRKQASRPRGS